MGRSVPAPRGSKKSGLASKVKVKGLMKQYAKFQRFFMICSIFVFDDISLARYCFSLVQ